MSLHQEPRLSIRTVKHSPIKNLEQLANLYTNKENLKEEIISSLKALDISLTTIKDKVVLIKPNWVLDNHKETDEICLTTHPMFILSVLEIVLELKPSKVVIADAPIQGCEWDKLLPNYFYDAIVGLTTANQVPIVVLDWRRRVLANNNDLVRENVRDIDNYILFDMGIQSYLEPITTTKATFRVTDYDPDRLTESHKPGKHTYCIAKEVFDVDLIIALPKAKTHQKTGITNALKLLVGINGDKDFLPHHRVGGSGTGGDCYPGTNMVLRLSEHFLDMANRRMGNRYYNPLRLISKLLWRSIPKTPRHSLAAAWHGNDTTWRMVMDLNMIAKYGKRDGSISAESQRDILYICDGIIGGQGDGPLKPDPLPLGVIMASTNPAAMDYALAALMGFDSKKLPLVQSALSRFGKPTSVILNGNDVDWAEIVKHTVPTIASPGWDEYLNGAKK